MIPDINAAEKFADTDGLALLFTEGEPDFTGLVDETLAAGLAEHAHLAGFTGKKDTIFKLPLTGAPWRMIYLVGLGAGDKVKIDNYRQAAARLVRSARHDRLSTLAIASRQTLDKEVSQALAEGSILGAYVFNRYRRSEKDEPQGISQVVIIDGEPEGVRTGKIMGRAQVDARDLANEPGNVITPAALADWAVENLSGPGLSCQVYDEQGLKDLRMESLWQVGKGSANKPRFIHAAFKPDTETNRKVVLVGKGLTFDSGGLDIKPGEAMRGMKGDKSGACAVLAVMKSLAELKPNLEVHGLVAAAENMPSGEAYRPDDIITTRNGKTVEIVSTDAEGRLTLADALDYASELKPDMIIDLATLTGACMIALGDNTAGLFTNDEDLKVLIETASRNSGERVWPLPLDDDRLRKRIKSGVADLLNSGGRYGGAITAAMFLEEFVGEGIKWAHIDMAGTDNYKEEFSYYSKGASGWGTRLLLSVIMALQGNLA